jgi:chromosome partitioning protein
MLFAFANPKGGVGKSTLAVHLAIWLGEKGRRTALALCADWHSRLLRLCPKTISTFES